MANSWITIPPKTGPLVTDSYNWTICNLSATTTYDYRAYMIYSGITYYGDICQITTLPIPTCVPILTTGCAVGITDNSMCVCGNLVNDNGSLSINEYGVLYTQNPLYGTDSTLCYNNYPNVCVRSICSNIPTGVTYFTGSTCAITGLSYNSETYYRSFAKNSCGYGYGIVKEDFTLPFSGITSIDLSLIRTKTTGVDNSSGVICTTPHLASDQCLSFCFNAKQFVSDAVGTGYTLTQVYCKQNGCLNYNILYSLYTNTINSCSTGINSVNLRCGDLLCYSQCNTGGICSCTSLALSAITSNTPNICPTINLTCYCDTLNITTYCVPSYAPNVSTGCAAGITDSSMCIGGNVVNSKGYSSLYVNEYGVLYTQNPSYGTSSTLCYDNYPYVNKKSICSDISTGIPYFTGSTCAITGLSSNTQTYYRAFSKNACGSGYGIVKQNSTSPSSTVTSIDLSLNRTSSTGCDNSSGVICASPSLGLNDCLTFYFDVEHLVCTSCGYVISEVFCKPNGCLNYNSVYCSYTNLTTGYTCGQNSVNYKYGDLLCYNQTNSCDVGNCTSITLVSIPTYSVSICPTIDTCCYYDILQI